MRVRIAALMMGLVLAAPAAALAQGGQSNPFTPGLPVPNAPAPTTPTPAPLVAPTTTSPASGGSGLSGATAAIIAIGAILLLAGISFFIWRDARRRAPVRHAHATAGGRSGSRRPVKPRKLSPAERRRRKRGRAR